MIKELSRLNSWLESYGLHQFLVLSEGVRLHSESIGIDILYRIGDSEACISYTGEGKPFGLSWVYGDLTDGFKGDLVYYPEGGDDYVLVDSPTLNYLLDGYISALPEVRYNLSDLENLVHMLVHSIVHGGSREFQFDFIRK